MAPSQQEAAHAVAKLRALVVADLVDSTALVERLGDQRAAELIRAHDRLARRLIHEHGGQEIDKTDGFLLMFERPVQAAAFALHYQRELRALSERDGEPIRARIGIHVGEVMVWSNPADDIARGAKPVEVEGLAKPVAARLMGLAMPGQILMSATAHGLAHRAASEIDAAPGQVRWKSHGNYRLKGVAEAVAVFEIGELDVAPFSAPVWTGKAHRESPWWRRPLALTLEVGLVLVIIAASLWQTLRPTAAIAFSERDWVVLADLRNLTREDRFDLSLSLATRVMVEQSQHVNLLSHLRTAASLKRMGKPEGTVLDAATAAEVAQREGARAVLLPSIREAGAGYEFAIEVIDPFSSRTVYTERQGAGSEAQVLAAVGEASDRVRQRLGEALQQVQQNSAPVPQVTSSSLDALRAYALGLDHYNLARLDSAESHFKQALALDPEFALATSALSRVRQAHNDLEQALELAEQAHSLRNRLSSREALFLDANLAQLRFEKDASASWDALSELYPDFHQALHNASLMHYMEGRYQRVQDLAARAQAPQSVTRPLSIFMSGLSRLALGDAAGALQDFNTASELGFDRFTIEPAGALMTMGLVDEALRRLQSAPAPNEFLRRKRLLAKLALTVDAGRWGEVEAAQAALREELPALERAGDIAGYRQLQAFQLALLSTLRGPDSRSIRVQGLKGLSHAALARHTGAPVTSQSDTALIALYLGYQLAREGELDAARDLLQVTRAAVERSPRAAVADMATVLEARLMLADGDAERALSMLDVRAQGNEILLLRNLRIEANKQAGHLAKALEDAEYMIRSRGRAYAEWGGEGVTLVENSIQINLAELRAAELALELGRRDVARTHLDVFRRRWPDFSDLEGLSQWVERLEQRLEVDPSA
ncbi:putative peptide modification system cyclase [Aquimonas sp.]|uniref:putative peptide modification system cyclase n=1 Tax=Aquimonas sp. TaxID=1872588 RepID=UPI0037BE604A